jgi:hypothetical protein
LMDGCNVRWSWGWDFGLNRCLCAQMLKKCGHRVMKLGFSVRVSAGFTSGGMAGYGASGDWGTRDGQYLPMIYGFLNFFWQCAPCQWCFLRKILLIKCDSFGARDYGDPVV